MRVSTRNDARFRTAGSSVVVMIVLLGIMLIFVGANLKTLHFLSRELNLIETRQVLRLKTQPPVASGSVTNETVNPVTVPALETNPPPVR